MAWQFAPVVYHHPLEKYHLIDPREWYNASELYLQARRPSTRVGRHQHGPFAHSLIDGGGGARANNLPHTAKKAWQ